MLVVSPEHIEVKGLKVIEKQCLDAGQQVDGYIAACMGCSYSYL